jgi:hypothetical protein
MDSDILNTIPVHNEFQVMKDVPIFLHNLTVYNINPPVVN